MGNRQHYSWTPEMEAQARRMREEGAGWHKIGKAIGRGHMTVQRYFKARGWHGDGKVVPRRSERDMKAEAARREAAKPRYADQLCWHCAKSGGRCVWSASKCRLPQPGWTAVIVPPRAGYNRSSGPWYKVIACPEFEEG